MPVIVELYNPKWAVQFSQIKQELENLLVGVTYVSIEHVGSTSVIGLPAKPILDIDIVIQHEHVDVVVSALENGGEYIYMGECGIPDRHQFRAPFKSPTVNLYACIEGSAALRNHVGVRDLLRSDSELRKKYGDLKFELGSAGIEIHEYMARKNEFVLELIKLSGALTTEEIEDLKRNNQPGNRVTPVKTERLMLREFVITDVQGLYELESHSITLKQAQDIVVKTIQEAGKKSRDLVELAVLRMENSRLIGRVSARVRHEQMSSKPTEIAASKPWNIPVQFSFLPACRQEGSAAEALQAFESLIASLVPEKSRETNLEISCSLADTMTRQIADQVGFERTVDGPDGTSIVYRKELSL